MADALNLVTAPLIEPITVNDVKLHARVTGLQDDQVIASLIPAARRLLDGRDSWLGRALITQTWDYFLPAFPCCGEIRIPLPPLQSVTSVKYYDAAGALQTLPPADYVVDTYAQPGRIVPAYGVSWPSTRSYLPNAVEIRFVAGYGAKVSDIPQDIRAWLAQAVAFLYENREAPVIPTAFLHSLGGTYRVEYAF